MYNINILKKTIENLITSNKEDISLVFLDLKKPSNHIYIKENEVFPSASTIKVLIMAEALNEVLSGNHALEEKIEIKSSDKVNYSIVTCLTNKIYPLIDLLTLMIISSDNTASNILIDLLTMDSINNYGKKIGLKTTLLRRKMMDSNAAKEGRENITTAFDMLTLFSKIYNKKILSPDMCDLMLKILSNNTDCEVLLRYLCDDIRCAHKTGDLPHLNHDIGIFRTENAEYILGVFVRSVQFNYEAKDTIGKISKEIHDFIA
ncbi:beta-lactamase class A [Clostridium acetobutylicum]|uniref:Beta-lactamase n=1 Tax=Clostridium acetobutylicum (strain ATCC 824 / DSM 792 / JCM 1419 / IAM 19013 / LMG 5710 / NBRC 13948 / NRRL B-527 / VKM B-1787 / 2291 / W) TaxID=272562 RepID=Q97MK6_CLOAB|nr:MULTISPECIES: serine hydrolase [Clostridium]AAK78172.1 Beta-lactamase [Clostridium acetobutylicum ATCC 824]ADZ19236.1 Beta-lactamase [Clostridium acetobutylicum EA 2018]AEI31102.1 Beta-lactamase [Clostridium acetobutylicum DSM 1731]AWV81979.1 serine hydrolase [Clostridium acetobutylicum]MBC2395952.1 serine hydrolase [Clostridium acetobutylicum]